MTKLEANNQTLNLKSSKKSYYVTEILMLKSIIVLLILTFFLLNEMQASTFESNSLKTDSNKSSYELSSDMMNSDQ